MPYKNIEKRKARYKVYSSNNKEKIRKWARESYLRNKEHKQQYQKEHADHRHEYLKLYRHENKDKLKSKALEYIERVGQEKRRERRIRKKDSINIQQREWRVRNPEKYAEMQMKSYKKHRGKRIADMHSRFWSRKKSKFGIGLEEFDFMLKEQEGKCSICLVRKDRLEFCLDHDHQTGKFRGIICDHCNRGLGQFKDDFNTVYRAYEYLRLHEANKLAFAGAC